MKQHQAPTRTSSGIRNGQVSFVYYILSLLVGFASRKVFLDYLGTDLLGLNTTAQNLLGFLNLSELGIGTAVAYTLYKPLQQNNRHNIAEIIALQGWMYRRIAYLIGGGAILLMLFFPLIFSKTDVPLEYAYASFAVFLYSSLLTYFFNYKQVLFSANQQQYRIIFHYQSVLLLKNIIQIAAVMLLPYPYVGWLVLHVLFSTLATWLLHRSIHRNYPYLSLSGKEGKRLAGKYPHLLTKIKQVFFHHIAGFALTQSGPLIIFAYTNLTTVALYANYQLISTTVQSLVQSLFSGIHAGIGNLVAEGNKQRILQVFEELFSIHFLLACTCCYCLIELMDPFIRIWIGSSYLLPRSTLYLIAGILYIVLSRQAVETYIAAHGMYQDIAAPIIETTLNIGLSCWLGYLWGIDGVLTGVLISLVIVVLCWKPYFLFRYGLKCKLRIYIRMYALHLFCLMVACMSSHFILQALPLPEINNYFTFFLVGFIHFITFVSLLGGMLWLVTPGIRLFIQRIFNLYHR